MNDRGAAFLDRYGRACWSLVLFVGGLVLLAVLHVTITYRADPGELGPAFWPRLWVFILLVLSGLEGLLALRRAWMGSYAAQDPFDVPTAGAEASGKGPAQRLLLMMAGAVLVALYVAATMTAGFAIATPVFIACFAYLGGYRRWLILLPVALISTVLLLYLFVAIVYIALPLGRGSFIALNDQIYKLLGIF